MPSRTTASVVCPSISAGEVQDAHQLAHRTQAELSEAGISLRLGTQVVKVFEQVVARTGLREDEARAAGFDPLAVSRMYFDHKVYYPGAQSVHLLLTGDRTTGHLLGAQMAGAVKTEIAKRIDMVATALFHEMTVEALSDLDLSYTPPLRSPWDLFQRGA